jgi:hypothetical protein
MNFVLVDQISTTIIYSQTITTVYLARNSIDAQGVQYLSIALQNNTVRQLDSHQLYVHPCHPT